MDLNRIRPAFRTNGAVTGNFGRQKVKAGSTINEIGMTSAENVRAVPPEEYYNRLLLALHSAESPRLITFLKEEILKYERQRGVGEVRSQKPARTAPPFRTPGT